MPQDLREKKGKHTHSHVMNKKNEKRIREITTTKKEMCSNQQAKNRNNVFNELAPAMKKKDLLETTLFFRNEENISVFMYTTVRRE
jgi:hypothetical protein